jgi:hypothetical protein
LILAMLTALCACSSQAGVTSAPGLMARLASDGDQGLFDARYVGPIGADGVLFVGTKGNEAIAYLCDPAAGSRWFAGSHTGAAVELSDAKGGRISGTTSAGNLSATITGVAAYDGALALSAGREDVRLIRDAGPSDGGVVAGLIYDGTVVRGLFTMKVTGTVAPTATGTRSSIAIGLIASLGSPTNVRVNTKPALSTLQEKAAREEIQRAKDKAETAVVATTTQFWIGVIAAIAAAVSGVGSAAGVGTSAVSALIGGSQFDSSTNVFLSKALTDIVSGLRVVTTTPSPGVTGTTSAPAVRLGTVSFGTLSGSP